MLDVRQWQISGQPRVEPRVLTNRSSHPALAVLLRQLNPVLQGWCTYFRYGVSKATFGYLDQYTWHRVVRWLRKRHPARR